MLSDRTIGRISLATLTLLYAYYSIWTLLTPLLPDSSPVQHWFPPREWAIKLPSLILLIGFSVVGATTGWILIETAKRKGKTVGGRKKGKGKES